jgi:hypothetical protein
VVSGSAEPAFAWGRTGHEVVNAAAVDLVSSPLAPLFKANRESLRTLSTIPDSLWRQGGSSATEAPQHYFQWDNYGVSEAGDGLDALSLGQAIQRLGRPFVQENGSAVWRASGLYRKLVDALRSHDWVRSLQVGAVLGHYVGDMGQPMHATSDYDGQSIGRRGIHSYFETRLVDRYSESQLIADALRYGSEERVGLDAAERTVDETRYVRSLVLEEAVASIGEMPRILAAFSGGHTDDAALAAEFGPRMGTGAARLSRIWDLAAEEAGIETTPATVMTVPAPAFIPPDEQSR